MRTESLSEVHSTVRTDKKGWRKILAFIGPAYLVSVGYMDPGNWATDIAGGSEFGYKLIWVLLMSNLIALLLQSLSARLGVVRGMDLAQASKNAYPKWANIPLYILAEIAIAACDLAEIVGMAIGLNLLFGLPLIWGVSLTAMDTVLLLFLMNKGMRTMEAFIVALVSVIGLSFLVEMFIVSPVYGDVMKGFVPSKLGGDALYIAIGIIGATVMPHNLYLHSSLVQTRQIDRSKKGLKAALKFNFVDSAIALNMAFLVNSAILVLAAAAFYVNGYFHIAEIQDASKLLDHLFGKTAPTFFGIALIAAGQSSTITGTLAGQIVMEGHLNLRIQPWLRRLITRLLAIIPALFTIIYFGGDALGSLLILSQVVLSLQLGFAVIPLIHFTSDRKTMKEFTIKLWVKVLAWISAAVIVYLNIKMVIDEIAKWVANSGNDKIYIYLIVVPLAIAVLALLIFIFVYPFFTSSKKKKKQWPHGKAEVFKLTEPVKYRHIGIAIDFSGNEQKIIQNALSQGGKSASYTLIHVVESAAARYHGDKSMDYETQLDAANLEAYQKSLEELGYSADSQIGFGDPASEISKLITKNDIDFLVVGSHGHKRVKDMVYGTTVDSLRHTIQIPLLIVT
ncbi:Nramp family divalent metal transporter [Prolixibacter denitrificans]|uniref:Divalent metal cation transporter MntH n=1 Tax=Prolixibacter denitrificans TaxID=1541063 RepID=A0A2P8CAM0_9BACT|nr:Nramp family divalent metal transporter [Prolixibacter denitrificans]PSK82019.1 manganese transport protein [Prolixibacter denitrificans]GET22612.1 divalent metal cation transporter MntH [Prolixibacter denitrificans]